MVAMEQFEGFHAWPKVNSCSTKQIERKRCLSGFGFLFCRSSVRPAASGQSARRASKAENDYGGEQSSGLNPGKPGRVPLGRSDGSVLV